MTNELLEQWRKEAEGFFVVDPTSEEEIVFNDGFKQGYIMGCKATHEKMQKEVDALNEFIDSILKNVNLMNNLLQNR